MSRAKIEKELYNNDVKQRYIDMKMAEAKEKEIDPKNPLINRYDGRIFVISSDSEFIYEKDVCNFSKDNILDFYFSLFTPSINYLKHLNSLYKQYTDWAIKENISIDGMNHFGEIELENLSACIYQDAINKTRITRKTLDYWVNHWTESYTTPQNKCDLAAVYLLFEGVKGKYFEDLLELSFDDIDYAKNTVKLKDGTEVKISKKCTQLLKEASEDEGYYQMSGKVFSFLDNKIIRSFRKEQLSDDRTTAAKTNALRARLGNFLNGMGMEGVTLNNVYAWGQVDYIVNMSNVKGIDSKDLQIFVEKEGRRDIMDHFRIQNFDAKRFYQKYKAYLIAKNQETKKEESYGT